MLVEGFAHAPRRQQRVVGDRHQQTEGRLELAVESIGVGGLLALPPAPGALATVAAACLGCLLIALPVAVRLVRQASPELLRGES